MASNNKEASVASTTCSTGSNPSTPTVIRHAYVNHSITGEKKTAKYAPFGSLVSEKKGTTSSFTR
jgi:hypothetical protein